jgi:predicted N-acetyltransferase YhbS
MPSLADAFRLHPLEIRPAEPSDAEAIIAFDEVAQRDPSRVAFIRRSTRSNDCFVASADGDVVGYAVLNYTFYESGCSGSRAMVRAA